MDLGLAVLRHVIELLADLKPRLARPDLSREEKALAVLRVLDRLLLVFLRRIVLRGERPPRTERHEVREPVMRLRIVAQHVHDIRKSPPIDINARRGIAKQKANSNQNTR